MNPWDKQYDEWFRDREKMGRGGERFGMGGYPGSQPWEYKPATKTPSQFEEYNPFYQTEEGAKLLAQLEDMIRENTKWGKEEARKSLITNLSGRGLYQSGQLKGGISNIEIGANRSMQNALSRLTSQVYGQEFGGYQNFLNRLMQWQRMQEEGKRHEADQPGFWDFLFGMGKTAMTVLPFLGNNQQFPAGETQYYDELFYA